MLTPAVDASARLPEPAGALQLRPVSRFLSAALATTPVESALDLSTDTPGARRPTLALRSHLPALTTTITVATAPVVSASAGVLPEVLASMFLIAARLMMVVVTA